MSLRPPNVSVFQCCDFVVYIIRLHAIGTSEKITWNLDVVPLMSPLLGAVVFCPQILMLREFGFGTSMYFPALESPNYGFMWLHSLDFSGKI